MRSFLTLTLSLAASTALAGELPTIVNQPATELAWERTAEGVAFAPLIGDRFVEPYMAMVRLPAGLVSPAHVKSADMYGLVLEGVMTHAAAGAADGVALPAGSFYRVPAGLAHVSACVSADDCVTFLYQDGAFDFVPVPR